MAGDVPGCAIDHPRRFTAAGQSHMDLYRCDLQPSCRVVQPRAVAAASTPGLAARYGSASLGRLDKRPSSWQTIMRGARLCLISHAYPSRSGPLDALDTTLYHGSVSITYHQPLYTWRHLLNCGLSMLLLRRLVFRGSATICRPH